MKLRYRYVKGSTAVEMSYIMPIFLLIFVMVIYTVFYYHDKVILSGAACETAVLGAQAVRKNGTEQYDLTGFFKERTQEKLIFMSNPQISITETEEEITVDVSVKKGWLQLNICQRAMIVNPEEAIRWMN